MSYEPTVSLLSALSDKIKSSVIVKNSGVRFPSPQPDPSPPSRSYLVADHKRVTSLACAHHTRLISAVTPRSACDL